MAGSSDPACLVDELTADHPVGGDASSGWAASGAMALTGPADGLSRPAPAALVDGMWRLVDRYEALGGDPTDGPALLGERAALAGHTCDECRQFYGVLMEQGFITASQLPGYLQECSRHKAKFSPDKTPEGFWDDENFSMPTPEEQQKRQCAATHARALTQMSQKGTEA